MVRSKSSVLGVRAPSYLHPCRWGNAKGEVRRPIAVVGNTRSESGQLRVVGQKPITGVGHSQVASTA